MSVANDNLLVVSGSVDAVDAFVAAHHDPTADPPTWLAPAVAVDPPVEWSEPTPQPWRSPDGIVALYAANWSWDTRLLAEALSQDATAAAVTLVAASLGVDSGSLGVLIQRGAAQERTTRDCDSLRHALVWTTDGATWCGRDTAADSPMGAAAEQVRQALSVFPVPVTVTAVDLSAPDTVGVDILQTGMTDLVDAFGPASALAWRQEFGWQTGDFLPVMTAARDTICEAVLSDDRVQHLLAGMLMAVWDLPPDPTDDLVYDDDEDDNEDDPEADRARAEQIRRTAERYRRDVIDAVVATALGIEDRCAGAAALLRLAEADSPVTLDLAVQAVAGSRSV